MASRRAVLVAVAVLITLIAMHDLAQQGPCSLDHSLQFLIRESAKDDRASKPAFLFALSSLARKHGAEVDAIFNTVEGGFAVEVGEGTVVVALQWWSHMSSGSDTRYLLLLDRRGRLLDRLSCDIDSRLIHIFMPNGEGTAGVFRTDMQLPPEPDGALLVIRYIPVKGGDAARRGHWINRGDSKYYSFEWNEGAIRYEEWMKKGLCRVTVRDSKFVILFPPLPQ